MKKGQPRIDRVGMWYRAESRESTNALNILSEEDNKRGISYGELMKTTDSLERYEMIRAYAAFPDDQNPDDTKAAECIGCRYWKSSSDPYPSRECACHFYLETGRRRSHGEDGQCLEKLQARTARSSIRKS